MEQIVHLSARAYRWLLRVYPQELRARFATDMAEVFEDLLHDALEQRGAAGIVELWRDTLLEFATVAVPARLKPDVIIAGSLSLVVSSLITWVFLHAVG